MSSSKLYSKEILSEAIIQSDSLADVARFLGKQPSGSRMNYLSRLVKEYGLDTSHFTFSKRNQSVSRSKRKSASEILKIYDKTLGKRIEATYLTRALIEIGVPYECKECHLFIWQDKYLVLDVDHINGDPLDCRAENLRFLCPNCHRQTPTFGRQKTQVGNFCSCGAQIQKRSKQCARCYANRISAREPNPK